VAALPPGADGKKAPAAVVLMSDGAPTIGAPGQTPDETVTEATAVAKKDGVPIDTIAFGTASGTVTIQGEAVPVPAAPEAMAKIASGSGGKSFTATTGNELNAVYDQIRKVVGFDTVRTDITEWFTGFALLLAVLTAGAALVWMQRIP
jgi:Ca-activated chloride channel family protein